MRAKSAAGTPLAPGSATGALQVQQLAWVRTPASKLAYGTPAAAATVEPLNDAGNPVIVLRTPQVDATTPQWKITPPEFSESGSSEKRDREVVEADDLLDDGNDENTDTSNRIVLQPPIKRQQLSKAQLRKRKFELSKLSVKLTECNMQLEDLVAQEKFFEADELKKEISAIRAQRTEMQAAC